MTWHLVQERCYSGSDCEGSAHEATVYFSGFYGKWRRVLVPVTHHLAQKYYYFINNLAILVRIFNTE